MIRSTLITTTLMSVIACTGDVRAGIIMTATEVGSDVVISGSGTVNLADLTRFSSNARSTSLVWPNIPVFQVGANASVDVYQSLSGPRSFGPGMTANSPSVNATGDLFGLNTNFTALLLTVPANYVSGTTLSGAGTFRDASIASLGMTPGTYVWTWGAGANADSMTLRIGPSAVVPEPSAVVPEPTTLALTGVALVCGLGVRWKQRRAEKRGLKRARSGPEADFAPVIVSS